jgi:ABC-2 type transport system permease protein
MATTTVINRDRLRPRATIEPAGRFPGAMVARHIGRKAARSGAVWGLVFAFYVILQTLAYTSSYKTQAARDQLESAFGTNIGLNAVFGQAREINTVAGYASWRLLGILSILGALWGLITSTRLLRGEEEAGRYELLLTGQTTRRRAGAQALAGLGVGLLSLLGLTAVGTILIGRDASVDFTLAQSVYLAVTMVAGAATFLAIGALTSQLTNTRRRAAAMAGAVFGVAYALRMVADSAPRLHWMVWLTPLGWIEESRPLINPHPLALLPVVALIVVLVAITVYLAGIRDVGAGTLPTRDLSDPHLALLGHPTGLAVRLIRPVAFGWLFGVGAFSLLLGTVAESSTKDLTGDTSVQQSLHRLGGHGTLASAYLGLTFLILALMIAVIAAGQIAAIRTEEAEGHLENFVVRPVSRTSWFVGRLLLSTLLLVLGGVLVGVATWAGAASQHSDVGLGSLVAAGLNVVPASIFLLGLGALVFGVRPRLTSFVVYAYLVWSSLLEFTGGVVKVNHWLMDTSVFFHMVPAPATDPNWASAAVIVGLGVAGAVIGCVFLNRRDVLGA